MAKELKNSNVMDNLGQPEIECYGPGMMLLIDITCFPHNGIFACLLAIPDAFTKQ